MAKLVWGQKTQVRYETGIDRGVLYPSGGPGVVWNGLVSVSESMDGGELTSYHFDGIKYVDLVSPKTFRATINAFAAPREFGPCVGERAVVPGFILTRQPRTRFGLSYRTLLGRDHYKLHLVYNALANPEGRSYETIGENTPVPTKAWTMAAVPPKHPTYRPSAHFVVDSSKVDPDSLRNLEAILYGTENSQPRLPLIEELIELVALWSPLTIVHDSEGGLSPLIPDGYGDLYRSSTPGLNRALPDTRLVKSLTDGLYRLES